KWLDDNKISDINSYKIDNIYSLVCKNSRFQLTENIYAVSADNKLRIVNYDCKLQQPVYKFDKTVISVKDFLNKCEFKNKRFSFYCDCDKIIGNVHIRSRKSGDFISPQNRNCTKSLKKFFNELKIPAENRNKIPVVTDSEGIIGICGYCADERVKIDYNTKKILAINVHTEDKD
ncbi:MAG: tRNA lysidine(34) synthetase TilS, partial [Clostridiales bacterium]|nr:tRNA lysidine(34) synthetase TilS [Clostridiales bacterium]